ncbi:hypothetical protein [Paenibacillus sp. FSL R5-0486]|uniref:hypothetical protein n=1 Tax=Paenibacillus sp. FSL R5-0486 TaxID=2921645 RepID=UPI0030D6EDD5
MFNINEIAEYEYLLILEAEKKYRTHLDTCVEALEVSWTFAEFVKHNALYFSYYLSQSNKALYLSLMSLLRKHTNQSYSNMRLSIESSIMACYELHRNASELLGDCESDRKKAYKWIESNYKNHSDALGGLKNKINKEFMHSSINSASAHSKMNIENGRFDSMLFDSVDDSEMKNRLVIFIQIILIQLSMYREVIEKYPLVEMKKGFQLEVESILKESYKLINGED